LAAALLLCEKSGPAPRTGCSPLSLRSENGAGSVLFVFRSPHLSTIDRIMGDSGHLMLTFLRGRLKIAFQLFGDNPGPGQVYRPQDLTMLFQIGEKVVFPNHGVGVIENVSSRSFGSRYENFYLLRLTCSSLTVMVPLSHASDLRLRRVTRNGAVSKVLCYLSNGPCSSNGDWKDRFKENSEKMLSGGLLETAQVLKGLLTLQGTKPLSFREKKMLDRARHMLITEIAVSRCIPEPAAIEMLQRALQKAGLVLPSPL
jgi:CarD family transcriptional regulator